MTLLSSGVTARVERAVGAALAHAWQRWCSYWLAPGGRISAAVLRIAVAVSLLWMLARIADHPPPAAFHHHGIWMLYPGRPSAAVVTAITWTAWLSTIALLLGVATRATHAASAIATLAIAAYAVSGEVTWSHGDVPPVLASLALLGARSGDALSIDAWWRARAPRGRRTAAAGYQHSVRLVQLVVAAVFVLAAYEKLRAGGLWLGWALSDSLRHHLLAWYDGSGSPRTPVANWLLSGGAWRYELGAFVNLVSQLSAVLAVIFVRRPWIRAIAGALWCSEVTGLGLVMNLWNGHWLPLGAAFIDWDAVAARLGARLGEGSSEGPSEGPSEGTSGGPGEDLEAAPPVRRVPRRDAEHPYRGRIAFVTGFAAFFAIQAFWLNQRLRIYPFSGFPLFAAVRAKRPYSRHQSYEFVGGRLEAIGGDGDAAMQTWLAQRASYRAVWRERRPSELARAIEGVLREVQISWPRAGVTGMRLWLSIFQAPAYPAPARIDRFDVAVLGELDGTGFRSALGVLLPDARTWIAPPSAPQLAGMALFAIRNDDPAPVAIAAVATGVGFVLDAPLRGDPVYLIGRTEHGSPWLLSGRGRRGY